MPKVNDGYEQDFGGKDMKSGKPFELIRQDTYLAFLYGGIAILLGMIIINKVADISNAVNMLLILTAIVLFFRSLILYKHYKRDKALHTAKKLPK